MKETDIALSFLENRAEECLLDGPGWAKVAPDYRACARVIRDLLAEIERLSSQAPLQVSGDAALRIRAEAIVASPYWGGCEKNIAEHILTGKYDSLHASVHKAALATPRGET